MKPHKVDAIQKKEDIERLRQYFRENYTCGSMYALLVTFGVNLGLRAGDLRKLKMKDLRNKDYCILKEQKTGKKRKMFINQKIKDALVEYESDKTKIYFDEHSFFSGNKLYPIQVKHIHKIIKKGCNDIGLVGNFGSHTLRKTFAYHAFNVVPNIKVIQDIFRHSDSYVTRVYVGEDLFSRNVYSEFEMRNDEEELELEESIDYVYANLNL